MAGFEIQYDFDNYSPIVFENGYETQEIGIRIRYKINGWNSIPTITPKNAIFGSINIELPFVKKESLGEKNVSGNTYRLERWYFTLNSGIENETTELSIPYLLNNKTQKTCYCSSYYFGTGLSIRDISFKKRLLGEKKDLLIYLNNVEYLNNYTIEISISNNRMTKGITQGYELVDNDYIIIPQTILNYDEIFNSENNSVGINFIQLGLTFGKYYYKTNSEKFLTVNSIGDLAKFNDVNFDETDYIKEFQKLIKLGKYTEAHDYIKSKQVSIIEAQILNDFEKRLYNVQTFNEAIREPITAYGDKPTKITKNMIWAGNNR